MAEHETLFEKAERLRINGSGHEDFQEAIRTYEEYLRLGGPKVQAALHMSGVCYQRLHEYEAAIDHYTRAMEHTLTALDYGNLNRDMGESYGALGEYELAEISLATSLVVLDGRFAVAYATSLGFLARLWARKGNLTEALEVFADADQRLHAGDNRHVELYNKLAYAETLLKAGQIDRARPVAQECLELSQTTDPATGLPYGSPQHTARARALVEGRIS